MATTKDWLAPNKSIVVYWEANRRSTVPYAVKSNRTDHGKTKKIILPTPHSGIQPKPGEVWLCRIEKITSKLESRGTIFVKPVSRNLEYKFDGVWIDPIKAQLIATVLQDPRKNLMLEGDQGVGKSTIAHAISKTLGWEFRKVSGGLIKKFVFMLGRFVPTLGGEGVVSKQVDEIEHLCNKLDDSNQGTQLLEEVLRVHEALIKANRQTLGFKWVDSKLVAILREAEASPHKVFLCMVDEYSRIDEDARDALLDVIEGNSRALRLPNGDEITVGKNVVFMAAANVGEGFTIRREDAAAKDRWEIVKITNMPQPEELAHCLRLYPNCPKDQLNRALTVLQKVRAARKDPKMRLSKTVSTRRAEGIAMYLAGAFSVEVALETAVVNQYSGSVGDDSSEAGRVGRLIKEALEK